MEMETMESKQLGCWSLQRWSCVIGWVQTIFCAFLLVVFMINDVPSVDWTSLTYETNLGEKYFNAYMLLALTIMTRYFIGIIAGILLVVGVMQRNPKKIKLWLQLEIFLLAFLIITSIVASVSIKYDFNWLLFIPAIILFLWVVNSHRNELSNEN